MALNSPYPPAAVARVPAPDGGGAVSGLLVPRVMGYLVVQVLFHGKPQPGLKLRFFERGGDGAKGDALGEEMETDARGVAGVSRLVRAGIYICEIEDQTPAEVPTVFRAGERTPIVLPVGRPFVDIFEGNEHQADEEDG